MIDQNILNFIAKQSFVTELLYISKVIGKLNNEHGHVSIKEMRTFVKILDFYHYFYNFNKF